MLKKLHSCIPLLCIIAFPLAAQTSPLGIASEYNVFMFGDITQYDTDVFGRAAGGRNVSLGLPDIISESRRIVDQRGFAVARKVQDTEGPPELVAGNNVALVNGSVGYFPDINSGGEGYQQGRVIWGGTATIAENVGYSKEKSGQGNPIDFASEQKYLTKMSSYWGNLSTEGNTVEYYYSGSQLFSMELNGENNDLNIFSIQASEFSKTKSFYFDVPISSTVLVNVLGKDVKLMDFGFFYITDDGTKIEGNKHNPGFPYSNILFNFLDAKTIEMSMIEINGSILAPYADILFSNGHIDGNLIAYSLRGTGESHNLITSNDQSYNVLFNGELPTSIPEPATMFLIGSGLAGIAAFRRRMES